MNAESKLLFDPLDLGVRLGFETVEAFGRDRECDDYWPVLTNHLFAVDYNSAELSGHRFVREVLKVTMIILKLTVVNGDVVVVSPPSLYSKCTYSRCL